MTDSAASAASAALSSSGTTSTRRSTVLVTTFESSSPEPPPPFSSPPPDRCRRRRRPGPAGVGSAASCVPAGSAPPSPAPPVAHDAAAVAGGDAELARCGRRPSRPPSVAGVVDAAHARCRAGRGVVPVVADPAEPTGRRARSPVSVRQRQLRQRVRVGSRLLRVGLVDVRVVALAAAAGRRQVLVLAVVGRRRVGCRRRPCRRRCGLALAVARLARGRRGRVGSSRRLAAVGSSVSARPAGGSSSSARRSAAPPWPARPWSVGRGCVPSSPPSGLLDRRRPPGPARRRPSGLALVSGPRRPTASSATAIVRKTASAALRGPRGPAPGDAGCGRGPR